MQRNRGIDAIDSLRTGSKTRSILLGLGLAAVAAAAAAQEPDRRSLPREIADEVVAAFNATGVLRVDGRLEVGPGETLERDVAILDGPLVVAGTVVGRVVAVNGDVQLLPGGRIDGDVLIVGGGVSGRGDGTINGDVRIYSSRLRYDRDGDRIASREDQEERWWQRPERWADGGWSELRLVSARTYNRVEGLPVHLGPALGREYDWGRFSVEALGVLRSNDSFDWGSGRAGHSAKLELDLGRRGGLRLGGRLFDVVEPVEPWQLDDPESGLAAFFLHRDFRDHYNTHGGSAYASVFHRRELDVGISYSRVRWSAKPTRDPWTLFRDGADWRPNPAMDEGVFRLVNATARFDTRNDRGNPWSGWYAVLNYEFGKGTIETYAPTTNGRLPTEGGRTNWDRLFVDIRRYNRISPDGGLNLRLAMGGWMSGDALPMQRRFSLGGPGTMPGYRFRHLEGGMSHGSSVDYWHCGRYDGVEPSSVRGVPAECDRFALAQVEFRGDLDFDPFGLFDDERRWRRRGWGRGAQFVVFADAGRGWLVGSNADGRFVRRSGFPALSTFQTDVGFGLVLHDVGLYVAKPVSRPDEPANFFLRLRSRF
ncbi:MAG: BamA/TamA family outer membrane protein [Gemmatimonadota bacterium]